MTHVRPKPPRAGETGGGGDASGIALKLPPKLSARIREAARQEGLSPAEWLHQAIFVNLPRRKDAPRT